MLKLRAEKSPLATDDMYSLACGPERSVTLHGGCIVDGIRFRTKKEEAHLKTQNSGVVAEGDHQSEIKDYYGILVDIVELKYLNGNRVFLFKCDWWDVGSRTGIRVDKHFTSVNASRTWYNNDPFVLANQARQVFYVNDTKLRGDWKVVQRINPRNVYDVLEKEEANMGKGSIEAYQQEEQVAEDGIILQDHIEGGNNEEGEDTSPIQLRRLDVAAETVDADIVQANMGGQQMEDTFVVDDEFDEEDDTLMNYFTEEEGVVGSDDDTDID